MNPKTNQELKLELTRTARLQGGQVIPFAAAALELINRLEFRVQELEGQLPKPKKAAPKKEPADGDK